ncbi:unnamed protein product, partial [Rotaria sp. Silwood2]
IPYADNG